MRSALTCGRPEACHASPRPPPLQVGKDEGKSVVYEFPTDLLREAGVAQGAPPFAVVSSTENDLSIGK